MAESVNDDFISPGRETYTSRMNPDIKRDAKIRAAEDGVNFADVVEYALTEYLYGKPEVSQEEIKKIFEN